MERSRRLYDLWSWLVPFRVVAETESLADASKQLHVASSALSRSVKLLEDRIGQPLFDRPKGGLKLNDRGRQLLSSVRNAMRLLDDGISGVQRQDVANPVYVSCPSELLPLLHGSLRGLVEQTPDILPSLDELPDADALRALKRGQVDVAVVSNDVVDDELAFRKLPALERGIFVGHEHPATSDGAEATELSFAVVTDRDGFPRDGFPNHVDRRIEVRAIHGASVLTALSDGRTAAVLPKKAAKRAGLIELPTGVALTPLRLALATRPVVDEPGRAELVAETLAGAFSAD